MSLFKSYCKEIIRELQKNPVYLPGESIQIGDIIAFKHRGLFGPRAIGSFTKKTDLHKLGIKFNVDADPDPDSYKFSSIGSVSMEFTSAGNLQNTAEGKLAITFSREGATYLAAADCTMSRIDDLLSVENQLSDHVNDLDWDSHYLVVGVTVAKKALIMQSNSSSSSLSLSGEVKSLDVGNGDQVSASIKLNVDAYKDASFIKEWSNNVAVFFDLMRYRDSRLKTYNNVTKRYDLDVETELRYRLEFVSPAEGLIED